ncbi:MAG: YidC/Oxa1 family membrane protein insertase [Lachnospiraceae bacterium]|nr:YidC/Oxa1 family membrane protein insertase [Lachnospiraceae bacterium]
MFDCLYNLVIGPLEILYKYVFVAIYRLTSNPLYSLFGLSLVVSLITLPMYNRADTYQKEDRKRRRRMEKYLKHIKATFRGEERYYMTQEYYRGQSYKPLYSIKGSLSLLLQIPFFIAAYNYLSNVQGIYNVLFIKPDGWIRFGNLKINALPIIMTLVNLVAGIIYSNGMKWKEKWQIFVLPLVFLVILYNSNAALVLYWTFNNIFSLIKNIVIRTGNSKRVMKFLAVVMYLLGMILFTYYMIEAVIVMSAPQTSATYTITSLVCLYIYFWPIIISEIMKKKADKLQEKSVQSGDKEEHIEETFKDFSLKRLFCIEVALVILMALYIPYTIFSSSPSEIFGYNLKSLWDITIYCLCIFGGVFIVWGNVVCGLMKKEKRKGFEKALITAYFVIILDFFIFKTNLGVVNPIFRFDRGYNVKWQYILGSIVAFAISISLIMVIVVKCANKLLVPIVVITLSMVVVSGNNMIKTVRGIQSYSDSISEKGNTDNDRVFTFSKNGKNVVVLMLDRAIGAYIPYIFDEKPELAEIYDGFTFYPNTVSLGGSTNVGSPSIFGGYEYIPRENEKSKMDYKERRIQAMKVMPIMFAENGYNVILSNLPFPGIYNELSIFDEFPQITSYDLKDKYAYLDYDNISKIKKTNMISYVLMKAAPIFAQNFLYDEGAYFNVSFAAATGHEGASDYYMLDNLNNMTGISETEDNNIFIFTNELPHAPSELQLPDYTMEEIIDNSGFDVKKAHVVDNRIMKMDKYWQYAHYHANAASIILVGKWLDYLKKCGVYDNTRIIITSDHGFGLEQFDELITDDGLDAEQYNCLLLVKDFESKGFHVDNKFMCNADVLWLATEKIIDEPRNPFTGKIIDSSNRNEAVYDVITEGIPTDSQKTYYNVHDNIFDKNNWTKVE